MISETKPKVRLGANYWKLWSSSVISNLGDGVAQIGYPWLASAVTRNGFLLALIAVMQRLPWLVFTLPAGVITDRLDRRKLIVAMDMVRFAITLGVAFAVLAGAGTLPTPAEMEGGTLVETNLGLYLVLLIASLLFGFAEVLRDNAAQTLMPAVVTPENLEKANGNLWGAEMVANSFAGPPLGSLLIGIGFAVPFFFDGGTFAVAAGLVFLLTGRFRAASGDEPKKIEWRKEIGVGFRWLWAHPLLRPMAIILGLMNMLGTLSFATFVLFAQEILDVSAFTFAILGTGGAAGGVIGSFTASRVSKRIGSGPSLYVTLVGGAVISAAIGVANSWPVAWLMFAAFTYTAVLWNVITVSLRQTIIPDALLGRVNSVYRFFAWGMMPVGGLLGGAVFSITEILSNRELALRMPFLVTAVAYAVLFFYAAPKLTTQKMEAAREEGMAQRAGE